ncbi:transcription factor ces-2-like [Bicyclus anynana]|uniref:Transcription factor ces-2-like n=1 Tax=Bicyclus anynana TaxID=110368 RepID=A0ABM3M2V9_BICAN|nr:transcription factor ces-2-like [Bicyclus anynana]
MDHSMLYELDPVCGSTASTHNSAVTALRLLRSYNHFVVPPDARGMVPLLASLPPPCLPSYCQHLPLCSPLSTNGIPSLTPCDESRRRGEKRPIPSEMKDEKYFERRRRNNQAAKKSRDARRMREDQIAWRACLLEQENASLRAHVNALRQETLALRALLAARDEAPAPTSTTVD